MEPNAENLKSTVENLKEYFYSQNKVKIMKAYATEQVTQAVIDLKKEYNKDVLPDLGLPINKLVACWFMNLVSSYLFNFSCNPSSHDILQTVNVGLSFFIRVIFI